MTPPSTPVASVPPKTPPVENIANTLARELKELHGTELHSVEELTAGGGTIAILPTNKRLEDLKPILSAYLKHPERRRGTARLTDEASFVAHLNRFASEESAVFANPSRSQPSLTAVFDYHPQGSDTTDADFMNHRAVYTPEYSDAWKAWIGANGKMMPQGDFAAFIEEHITDVIVPDFDDPNLKTFADLVQGKFATPSDLVQLSRGLQVNVDTVVKNAVTLGTGEISVRYEESHRDDAGKPISIANLFQVCIPVFYAGVLYRIAARLRYRIMAGKLHWSYLLVREDKVFDDAFRGIVRKVSDETKAPVFLGSPEA